MLLITLEINLHISYSSNIREIAFTLLYVRIDSQESVTLQTNKHDEVKVLLNINHLIPLRLEPACLKVLKVRSNSRTH